MYVKHRGVRFRRIRDFKQYYSNSIPPTSQCCLSQGERVPKKGVPAIASLQPISTWVIATAIESQML